MLLGQFPDIVPRCGFYTGTVIHGQRSGGFGDTCDLCKLF